MKRRFTHTGMIDGRASLNTDLESDSAGVVGRSLDVETAGSATGREGNCVRIPARHVAYRAEDQVAHRFVNRSVRCLRLQLSVSECV